MDKTKRYSRENAKEPFPEAQWQIEGSSDWIWEGGEMRRCWHQGAKLDDNCALYLTSAPKIPFGFKMGAVIKLWKAVVWKYIIYKQQAAKRTQLLGLSASLSIHLFLLHLECWKNITTVHKYNPERLLPQLFFLKVFCKTSEMYVLSCQASQPILTSDSCHNCSAPLR